MKTPTINPLSPPTSKEAYLINFIGILSEYDELEHSPQGIALYEMVRNDFLERGMTDTDVEKSFELAKCMKIAEAIMLTANMEPQGNDILENGKVLLSNVKKRDEILSSLLKDMPLN